VSAKPEAADSSPAPAKSKKLLIIVGALVLVLILAGVGGYIFISKRNAAAAEDAEDAPAAHASHDKPKAPPVYLPLDPMVVNLADQGGEKVAQVGITLEVMDAKASDTVKGYLPTIRSGILLLISQKTAEELLKPEGKEKLASEILKQAAIPFGGGHDDAHEEEKEPEEGKKKKPKKKKESEYPVIGVLFSSFIVQ
jgi:flagellar protein FliL